MRLRTSIGMIALSTMVAPGCNDDISAPVDSGPADVVRGTLEVSIAVTGPTADPKGYAVVVSVEGQGDLSSEVEPRGGTARFRDVPPGTHSVDLEPRTTECSVLGGSSRRFTVVAGETSRIEFNVFCPAPGVAGVYERVSPPDSRYVIDETGTFELQYYSAGTGSLDRGYRGSFSVLGTEILFDFRASSTPGEWQATGTLSGGCLTVEYNIVMLLSDFKNGEYCRQPDDPDDPDEPAGVTELTRGAAPDWSPDGQRIAFHRDGQVYVIDADGSNEVRLVEGTEPAWSPAGGWIAFQKDEKIHVLGIFDIETVLTQGTEPAWSPDGTKIVFTSSEGISVMNADGSGVTTLIRHDFRDDTNADWDMGVGRPAWSPDGARIAFEHLGDGDIWPAQIFVMNADGSDPRRPTATGGITYAESDPAWSPGGARIVFWSYGYGIATVDAEGGVPKSIYKDFPTVAYGAKPDWSPDGSRIAFTARPPDADGPVIWIVSAD